MIIYLLIRALAYLFFGAIAVYLIEKIREKPISWEMRCLIALTGSAGFFVMLIVYLGYRAFK